jgi:FixJ family two-component response regulator
MKRKCIIYVIDDDPSVRKSTTLLLKSEGYEVETYESAERFLDEVRNPRAGCIVLDVQMKGMNGLELQEELIKKHFELPIVFVTGFGDVPMSVRAMKKGAYDFLEKPFNDEEFLSAVRSALERNLSNLSMIKEKEKIFEEMMMLTDREKEILKYIIAGYMNKEISAKLGIAEPTVKIHRGHIMSKLCVDSIADLVRKAEKAGIIPEKR